MQQSSYSGDKMKLSTYGGVVNDNTRPTTRVRFNNQPTTLWRDNRCNNQPRLQQLVVVLVPLLLLKAGVRAAKRVGNVHVCLGGARVSMIQLGLDLDCRLSCSIGSKKVRYFRFILNTPVSLM